MARFHLWLALAMVAWVVTARGQDPVLTGPPLPPEMAIEAPGQDWFADPACNNCYPMFRCEDGNCCNQWWCKSWYGRVELLTLARNYAAESLVLVAGTAPNRFTTDDIGFKLAPGVSTLVGRRIDGDKAFELSYFGANQWNLDRAFTQASTVDLTLQSQLHNAEVNFLMDLTKFSLLAGFRYVYLGEQLEITSSLQADRGTHLSNNLAGGQLGFRSASYWHGLDLEATGKAGIFGNQATVVEGVRLANLTTSASMTNGTLAFVGDLNFTAACPITRHSRLRAGYNLMYMSGIALAANQPSFFANGPRNVRQDSDVFLHGFNVGIETIW